MRLSYLVRGLPGHPLHPPLTDATIGTYTVATALTGLAEWLGLEWGSPLWRTATIHLLAMVTAAVLFLLAALFGHAGYVDHAVRTGPLILTLVGFGLLTLGGWLGGTIVYVHGMRVLNLVGEPARRASAPVATPEKELAERGA